MEQLGRIPLGVIPAGSGNGIAASLGWKTAVDAALSISAGEFSTIDTFEYTQLPEPDNAEAGPSKGHMFLLVCWGMLSDIDFGSEKWRWMGEFRFTLMGAIKVLTNESYPCEIHYLPPHDEREHREAPEFEVSIRNGQFEIPAHFRTIRDPHFLCASSGDYIATSTKIAPGAKLNDGYLYLVTASDMNFFQRVGFLLGIEDGSHIGNAGVGCVRAEEIVIVPHKNPQMIDIDGERFPNTPVHVKRTDLRPRFAS